MRVGAIDIGSNSIRLLVAEVGGEPGEATHVRSIARAGVACRLGRGLGETRRIDPEMIQSAARLTAEYVERARSLGAVHVLVGATAALRSAENGSQAAEQIGRQSGLPVRVLSGEEEARLVYQSVIGGLGAVAGRCSCVVFDLGGGSTEVVSGLGFQAGRWVSLPFGAVNLTERYVRSNPASSNEIGEIKEAVSSLIMHECAALPREAPVFAGVGGTVTILALLDRDLTTYEPSLIEGWVILPERLDGLVERIAGMSHDQRRRLPAMGEGRADIVVAGCIAVRALAERFSSTGLVCSTQGLRYGLARLAAEEWTGRRPGAG
jgi:exopolyphosphatase/guanosine-5'-triphosphate,3'-diphosphate pyrophosphatase